MLKRLATHASQLTTVADDTAALEIGYALFQAPLMLLTQARQVHALDEARDARAGRVAVQPSSR